MQLTAIQRILGLLLMLFSTTMLPPILVSVIYSDGFHISFLLAFALTFVTGVLLWLPVHRIRKELRLRDGFLVVVLFWTVLGVFGALPFFVGAEPNLSITDAVFESISGLTTTARRTAALAALLPPAIAVAGRDGDYCVGGCHSAYARYRGHAALSGRDTRPDEGQQTDPPHH